MIHSTFPHGDDTIRRETLLLPVKDGATLCLHRFCPARPGPPVFMLHGAIGNGQIFYSHAKARGFAYYLAAKGYDVYVGDLRGRGSSYPPVGPHARYGQTEAITEDIPCFLAAIMQRHANSQLILVAHSWGGVLLSSYLARYPEARQQVSKCIYFGSKRSVEVKNLARFISIDLIWNILCPLAAQAVGYLPARQLQIGADNESRKSLAQSIAWVKAGPWVDSDDGFPYGEKLKTGPAHPPVLLLSGANDPCLGHPEDVYRFQKELCAASATCVTLRKGTNARHNYDHVDILIHPDAPADHFPKVLNWINCQSFA